MTTSDHRSVALDEYLAGRAADGYEIETRGTWQAVIIRRRRSAAVLRLVGARVGQSRLVVSVDEGGAVTAIPAQPLRW